jgi:hypothetical protein
MRAHLDLYAEDLIARGVAPAEARRQARIKFGNPRVKLEEIDAASRLAWLDALCRDLRHACRSLSASRSVTIVILLVLTVGVGVTTAVFSVVDAVVLRGLPFDDAGRLVGILRIDLRDGSSQVAGFDAADTTDYRQRQDVFEALAAVPEGPIAFTLRDNPVEQVYGTRSTADLFSVLRVQPQLGRLFSGEHEIQGNHRVVLISDRLWRRRNGHRPNPRARIRHARDHRRHGAGVYLAGRRSNPRRRLGTVGRSRQRAIARRWTGSLSFAHRSPQALDFSRAGPGAHGSDPRNACGGAPGVVQG